MTLQCSLPYVQQQSADSLINPSTLYAIAAVQHEQGR
ncbi:hypothetical protein HMPREF9696_04065 [Afipia clevelandensis ATCC 49720]|uniref:Uncharacterized protein n=1 Tax=Afipia clevelandensis ATCC 49720 TaxID=883079 RepID=K8NTQ0_9BRAD|nr:hypothetical protein HMPREF9696_04065 [Afipia clevelandensis ATCC 49720]